VIERLVGEPYVGRFGCFVVARKALEMLGKHIPDYAEGLREEARLAELQKRLQEHAVEVDSPQRGDVVILRVMGQPDHIGVMVDQHQMLHCMDGTNACIERLNSRRWKGRVCGFWRL
jgi:cell wall-associated NlpC family hydrolase